VPHCFVAKKGNSFGNNLVHIRDVYPGCLSRIARTPSIISAVRYLSRTRGVGFPFKEQREAACPNR